MELVYKEKLKENIEEGIKTQHKVDFDELFPDKRLENLEETELRQCQLILLRILKIVAYICDENSLTYWLDSGTLLGAFRHKGFIPWDDDQGFYIDIFPMDSYSDNFFKRVFYEKIHRLLYIKVQAINAPLKKPFFKGMNFPKNIIKILLKIVFFVFAIFDYNKIYEMNLKSKDKRIESMKTNPKTNYGYGTEVLNWDPMVKAEDIMPVTKKLKFEDGEFSVPNNTEAVLIESYGNTYMQIPKVDKQVYHNLSLKSVLTKEEEEELNRGFHY